jgi:hypothetical protein
MITIAEGFSFFIIFSISDIFGNENFQLSCRVLLTDIVFLPSLSANET